MKPKVSVIITTRNSARTLEKCLLSIITQTYKPIELIVVDNNSTDATKKIARTYTRFVYNHGIERSAQRNFGVSMAKGKYVLIHDSDIYFHPDSVAECVNVAEETPCHAVILPERSIGVGFWAKVKSFEREFYVGNPMMEAARFFRKNVYQGVGGYDEALTACEDWDLQWRLNNRGFITMRARHMLLHDEGKISLISTMRKKKYYGKWIHAYERRYPKIARRQFSFFARFPPLELAKSFVIHPLLTLSMVVLKTAEWLSTRW